MTIQTLELNNFRNYEYLQINFDDRTNILFGQNGQGKTNILESVYLSGTTKSHRGAKDREMIRFDQNEAHVKAVIEKEHKQYQIDIHLKKNKTKGIAVNKNPIRRASDLFGILNVIVFSPEDLSIIKNGPRERRRFLDSELCQIDKIYLHDLSMYNKILNQRNQLLKDIHFRPELKDTLDVWNMQILEYGTKIIRARELFINRINDIVKPIHHHISGNKEHLIVQYEKNVSAEMYEARLEESLSKDIQYGQTNIGPHKDDLCFESEGIDMRKYGSQGQQRTCALSLKLAEIELVKKEIHDMPVLLLDDVLSELDSERQNLLLEHIQKIQTIITCTGMDEFVKNRFQVDKIYQVAGGNVTENIVL